MSFRPRVIPILQLSSKGFVKTLKFENPIYIGDPINTVKLFNDYKADEIVIIDIEARTSTNSIQFDLLSRIIEEAYMPVSYGGGINSIEQASKLISLGIEKLILGSSCYTNPELIHQLSKKFGAQAIMCCLDLRKINSTFKLHYQSGKIPCDKSIQDISAQLISLGCGELLLQFIDGDGTMKGIDAEFIKEFTDMVNVPVVVAGGISSMEEIRKLTIENGASAAGVGSLFTFMGSRNSVLINYPDLEELNELFK